MTEDNQQNEQQSEEVNTQDAPELNDGFGAIPNITFNRKFRRAMLKQSGYVKLKNKLGYKDWFENVKNNIQNGKQLHATNTEDFIRRAKERMEKSNESLAGFLLEKGYTEEQAGEVIERNMEIHERISMKKIKP